MVELVSGTDSPDGQRNLAEHASIAFSLEVNTAAMPSNDASASGLRLSKDAGVSLLADLLTKLGLQRRTVGADQEFFYRADGVDNVVLKTSLETNPRDITSQLDRILSDKIASVEKRFGVDIASAGEEIDYQQVKADQCSTKRGDMMHAVQPTLPVMHAIEHSLKRSTPSQFTATGAARIYLLDKPPAPNIYGNRPILGLYTADRQGRVALYLTPAGLALPPTGKDAKEGSRNLSWVMSHELTHNSQNSNWREWSNDKAREQSGWHESYTLKGKSGEYFRHLDSNSCTEPSAWYRVNRSGEPLNRNGVPVKVLKEAQTFTNDQVIERAAVKPITYYFMNQQEMHSEALTSFRSGRESRAKLMATSPELYKVAKDYDQTELAKVYGRDQNGNSKFIRTPEGFVVRRESVTERSVALFEKSVKGS